MVLKTSQKLPGRTRIAYANPDITNQ